MRLPVLTRYLAAFGFFAGGAVLLAVPPAGFEDSLVAAVPSPTAIAFTPDGRLLTTTQVGTLRVIENDVLRTASALDLSASICTNSERGLLGVAVDPAFATNHYIYLYYTFNKSGVCEKNTARSPVNRVSRFTLSNTSVADRASELVLIDNIPSPNGNHNGGDLHFGPDGYLYVSTGDGGCDYAGDSGCAGSNDASRDQHVLGGKLLRITRSGGIPSGNPFVGSGTARCNVTGRTSAGQKCQETFAWGFRNPFRFAFDPEPGSNRLFVNDVGQDTWEEVNQIVAGADYGWNLREGRCANASTTNCGAPPAGMTNPIYAYGHGSGCASITGGAFVPSGVWPATYQGAYIFGDYVCGSLFTLLKGTDGSYARSSFDAGLGANSAVSLIFGPYAGTLALYYTTYANGGQVRRVAYTGNRTPTAGATASPLQGSVPLTVRFDASSSSDPDGDPLTYDWNFDDGSAHAFTAVASHSFGAAGQYDAVVKVTDPHGASATKTVRVSAGNTPPVPKITSPSTSTRFTVGQTITLTGSAVDAEEGTLPASALSWTVILHHNTHTHPFLPATSGNGVTFMAPAPEDLAGATTSYLEIRLTATDSQGGTATITQRLDAARVSLTFATDPAGLSLGLNETTVVAPQTITSWAGYVIRITAVTQVDPNGQRWLFAGWSDGGAATHSVTSPTAARTYTARYVAAARLAPTADTFVRGGTSAAVNYGTQSGIEVKKSAMVDNMRDGYLKFDLRNVSSIGIARLRLFGALRDARNSNVPTAVHSVASSTWTETGLIWNNRPAGSTAALDTTVVANAVPSWHEWDVTSYLRTEKAAGRSTVSLLLRNTVTSSPATVFNAREASSNDPELVIAPETSGTADDIVLRAGDATTIVGLWRRLADTSAAGGFRLSQADAGAPKRETPLASPSNYVDLPFTAEAGQPYRLWIRGRADRDSYANDSAFVQFTNSVDQSGQPSARVGTTSAVTFVLESCNGCGVAGWGWEDNGYGAGVLGPLIYFATSGPQTLRIQTREDGLSIDQIVLSPSTYLSAAPGAAKNDTTIVPR
jgi:glucose/arabinose dehydrogenase/PKD repeat protein